MGVELVAGYVRMRLGRGVRDVRVWVSDRANNRSSLEISANRERDKM